MAFFLSFYFLVLTAWAVGRMVTALHRCSLYLRFSHHGCASMHVTVPARIGTWHILSSHHYPVLAGPPWSGLAGQQHLVLIEEVSYACLLCPFAHWPGQAFWALCWARAWLVLLNTLETCPPTSAWGLYGGGRGCVDIMELEPVLEVSKPGCDQSQLRDCW